MNNNNSSNSLVFGCWPQAIICISNYLNKLRTKSHSVGVATAVEIDAVVVVLVTGFKEYDPQHLQAPVKLVLAGLENFELST